MIEKIFIKREGEVTLKQISKIPRLTKKYLLQLREEAQDKDKFDKSILTPAYIDLT